MICILQSVWRLRIATLAVVIAGGAGAPALATKLQPLWQLDSIVGATLSAVRWLVGALGYDVVADPVRKHIGSGDFMISVAPVCSGIKGIALVTIFASLYLWLFRPNCAFPMRFCLIPWTWQPVPA